MTRGINKVILIGNLGNDPEVRFAPNGGSIANLSLATSETWKDKNTGEQNERTEWHKVVLFNRLGEIAGQYLKKGAKVYIEGSLRTRKWQDNNGHDRYTTEIIASELQMLDSKNSTISVENSEVMFNPTDKKGQGITETDVSPSTHSVPGQLLDDDIPF